MPSRFSSPKRWIYLKQGYPEIRNIHSLHGTDGEFRKWSHPNVIHAGLTRVLAKVNFLKSTFFSFLKHNDEIFHLFNGVMFGRSDWVTTMESVLPRMWQYNNHRFNSQCLRTLAAENCKAIVAISFRAKKLQLEQLNKWVTEGLITESVSEKIAKKIILLPPPQKILGSPCTRKEKDTLRLIFVGNLFFLKGGREAFFACRQLVEQEKIALQLIVVSSIEHDDWFSKTSERDSSEWKALLEETPWVEHFENLPNQKVLNLIHSCHLGIFPTKRDSYGYFTLEAQAYGLPVITSDYGAQKEINSSRTGWVVSSSNKNDSVDPELVADLKDCIEDAFDEAKRFEKGMAAAQRIRDFHNPETLKKQLYKHLAARA